MLFWELEEESKLKWQQKWEESPKAALTKQFSPRITDRLKSKIDITSNFTPMFSGHGKTRAYVHRFKLLKVQHVLATRELSLRTTCYTNAPYFINKAKNS